MADWIEEDLIGYERVRPLQSGEYMSQIQDVDSAAWLELKLGILILFGGRILLRT